MSLNFENVGKEVIYNRSVDNIEDYVKGTIVGCYIGTDEEYYITSIESSGECIKVYDDSLLEILSGGGGSVTPNSIVTATSQMTEQQSTDTRNNISAEPKKMVVTVSPSIGQAGVYVADKTIDEIYEAYSANKSIFVYLTDNYEMHSLVSCDASSALFGQWTLLEDGIAEYSSVFGGKVGGDDFWAVAAFNYYPKRIDEDDSSTVVVLDNIVPYTTYKYDELTSLTISNPPVTGEYSIVFTSGSTATTTTIPNTVLGLESFAAEANKLYEINVLDNRAVVGSWDVV